MHSYHAESDLSRQAQAKQIWYALRPDSPQDLQKRIDRAGLNFAVAVQLDDLLSAFELAVDRFECALAAHPARLDLVSQRARNFFDLHVPPEADQPPPPGSPGVGSSH